MKQVIKNNNINMRKLKFLFTIICLIGLSFSARAVVKDGIEYKLDSSSKTATVIKKSSTEKYSGDVVIPNTIEIENVSYNVSEIGNEAFSDCRGLTSVIIPNSVTTIGNEAFSDCRGLTSVIIPNSVTSIGNKAFYSCSGLKKSAYPNTLKNPFSYGVSVAYDPKGAVCEDGFVFGHNKSSILFAPYTLEVEYTIPTSVTSIGNYAFYSCSGLTSVTIPTSVTSIGNYAFDSCSGLTSVTIPNSVTSIGDFAFSSCSGLTSVTIPNSVTSIGDCAFLRCSGLTSVIIPNSVTSIGNTPFYSCSGLKKSAYPNTLENPFSYGVSVAYEPEGAIIEDGFIFGPNKSSIRFAPYTLEGKYTIPNSVTSIESNAFLGCDSIKEVSMTADKAPTMAETAFNGLYETATLSFPKRALSSYLSSNCMLFKSIKFIDSETPLKHYSDGNLDYLTIEADSEDEMNIAFVWKGEYGSLIAITIPERFSADDSERYYVTGIGYATFKGCKNLKEVNFHNKSIVSSIGDDAFRGTAISTINLPPSVSYIGKGAFKYSNLGSLTLPNSVAIIEDETFYGCGNLYSFNIPDWIVSIGKSAFRNCEKLYKVIIPNSVTSIGENAFSNCSDLTSVTIPGSVTSIGENAFYACSRLIKSAYPNSLANPFNYGFAVAYDPLETIMENGVIFGHGKSSILFVPYTFSGKYVIPNSITSVGASAFAGCTRMSSIVFGNGVKTIADNAFAECGLSKVVLPPAVESIGNSAFAGNASLKEVAMGANVKSIGDKAFDNIPLERVYITAPEPPVAPNSAFSRYTAKLYVQGSAAVNAYYDATSCWDRFEGYAMSEPKSLTMEKPKSVEGKAGEQFTLKATLTPANVDLPYIFWRSTDSEKAYVDNDGNVTVLHNITAEDNVEIIAETLYYNGPTAKFSFATDASGVNEIVGDTTSTMDVYTLQGVQVLRNATREQFENLAGGIYIVRNGKDVKKVVK